MKITVILCTYNRCRLLAKALESVAASALPESVDWEVLVVDNNSNDETRQILALVENHMRFADSQRMKDSTLKRFFRLENFKEHLALHRMDCMAASRNLDHWEFVRERYAALPEEAVRPQPLITGRELIAAGYVPGAKFKDMLRAVEDAQLEGSIATQDEGLALVRKRFPKPTNALVPPASSSAHQL